MKNNRINELYKNAWHYMKGHQLTELGLDDSVYINLLSAIYPLLKNEPLFCDDIMCMCVDRFLSEDMQKESVNENRTQELIEFTKKTFELNKKTHYLLIPINGCRLSKDIDFAEYHFITGSEEEKERKLISITNIGDEKIKSFIEHTQKSRSEDFLKHSMLVMKIDDINTNVYRNASFTAQRIFQIIKLMVYYLEIPMDIYEMAVDWNKANYHVGIVGDEEWQMGHGNWWNLIQCKYSLDFLNEGTNQELFCSLVNTFICKKSQDELYYKFSNALELFERSLEQEENHRDTTLSLMLLFSSAESLLTESENEKKLRLSVIWPRLVKLDHMSQKELGITIKDAYERRNDFVHAGNLLYNSEKVDLRSLHQALAKLIVVYLDRDTWKENISAKDINDWKRYINKIFTDAIYL